MRFANRPNERLVAQGRVVFDSRSAAVTAIVIGHDAKTNTHHALAGERGPAVDLPGHWCLVCGYLDWDESLVEAVRREVFEEAGIDLGALEAAGDAIVPSQPILVQSDPRSHRQNVTARFPIELRRLAPPSTVNAEPGEVSEVCWIEVARATIANRRWAFGHDEILGELADFYADERAQGRRDMGSTRRFYRRMVEARYPFA